MIDEVRITIYAETCRELQEIHDQMRLMNKTMAEQNMDFVISKLIRDWKDNNL